MNEPEILERLSVDPATLALAPRISPELGSIMSLLRVRNEPGSDRVPISPIYYLRCADAVEARAVLAAYDSVPVRLRRRVSIEALCVAAQVSPWRILEIITGVVVRICGQASAIVAAVAHPAVVAKTVDRALDDGIDVADATHNAELLHRAVGFLPTPKSAQTTVNIQQNALAASSGSTPGNGPARDAIVDVESPEATIRHFIEKFNERTQRDAPRALPPTSATPMPEHKMNLYPHDSTALPECGACAEERGKHPVPPPAASEWPTQEEIARSTADAEEDLLDMDPE